MKQKILILGAMERELRQVVRYYCNNEVEKRLGIYPVWRSTKSVPFEVIVVQTHVGDTNASIASTLAINTYNPDYVCKLGCVGGFSNEISVGDVVSPMGYFSTSSWITRSNTDNSPTPVASLWQSVFGDKPYQINYENLGEQPYFFDANKAARKYEQYLVGKGVKVVPAYIGSSNTWFSDLSTVNNVTRTMLPSDSLLKNWVADMESYSIAKVCHVFGRPLLGFYRVSDNYLKGDQYNPNRVSKLFDLDYLLSIDQFLKTILVSSAN